MANGNAVIEAACASLVREYLSRKGLKGTLQKMDEEFPRNELSISNRQALMKHVHIEKLLKRNKEEREPLAAMLEIMTKYFMEHIPHLSVEKLSDVSRGSSSGYKSNSSSGFEMSQPLMKYVARPDTVTLEAKRDRERAYSDLIMDEDVDGETVIGGGRSGIMELETTESAQQYATRTPFSRPLSAKHGVGTIFSNDDALAIRRRSQPVKLTRVLLSQQEQQQKKGSTSNEGVDHSSTGFFNNTGLIKSDTVAASKFSLDACCPEASVSSTTSKLSSTVRKPSPSEDSPVSFEALLLKGKERANLLHRKGQVTENKNTTKRYKVESSSMMGEKFKSMESKNERDIYLQNSTTKMDLVFGEVEDVGSSIADIELKPAGPTVQKSTTITKFQPTPVDLRTAIALKNIVLGSPNQQYSDEWLLQSYNFCDTPDIKYGFIQKKGGPCGVLAAVQACLIQEMLFGKNKLPEARFKNPSKIERSNALALALSNIFWRAGDYSQAIVTMPSQTTHVLSSTKFKQDGVTETLDIYTFTNFDELSSFLMQSVSQFECDGSPGVILTVYSAILSRKPHQVSADFDVPEQTNLLSNYGYCIQELVNLLLTGRAVSNIFNDVIQLESGVIGQSVTLKGISSRSDIGFLSLFEHYKTCQVGTYYKTPKNPIWVICSESHFSVLFSTRRDLINDWKAERRFDLIYYDGLARQQEEIKLSVSTLNQSYKPSATDEDLVPPLEHCIRTKWEDAEISWNGYEPIL